MNKRIRTFALVSLACFALLLVQLGNLQVRQAPALRNSQHEPPAIGGDRFEQPRGEIVSSDGVILAYSAPTNDGYHYLRHYPEGPLFAGITGYYDVTASSAPYGMEDEYNHYLSPNTPVVHNLNDILTERPGTDSIEITVSAALQKVAAEALGDYRGAVIAIDPRTGAIDASYSNPTYDPNKLSSGNAKANMAYYQSLDPDSGNSPLVNGVTQQRYPPGSTFKVVTTSTIFDHDPALESIVVPAASSISLPDTDLRLHNFADETCGGALPRLLAISCDTAYAKIGLKLGARNLYDEATSFGFDKTPPIDLPSTEVIPANFPSAASFAENIPGIAYSAIGQENVAETALQDALVASAIGDDGTIMTPHFLSRVIDAAGNVVDTYTPHPWLQATSALTAEKVRSLMRGVVTYGTAANVGFPADLSVAAKTGTAETAISACTDDWLIATAPAGPGEVPKIAVAAVVVQPPGRCDGTGAEVAGPIVKAVLVAALGLGL
ncbi:MAG TPA: penicillin-binding transpeptidase domain-containing protein [Acidimicrobiales bacterium]|nr:penicillin-binding transpeptidase domain-containing protein [Acidimicrobiales bacterium]